jgi:hypothetical protein
MSHRIAPTAFALAAVVFLGAGAAAAAAPSFIGIKDAAVSPSVGQTPVPRPFKLKAGGAIDINTFAINFAGTATHIGLYSAAGVLDPSTFQLQGTMTAADGDTLDWTAQFQFGPLGEIDAVLTITGGTGRFAGASGTASGLVALDADFMFTLNLDGQIAY